MITQKHFKRSTFENTTQEPGQCLNNQTKAGLIDFALREIAPSKPHSLALQPMDQSRTKNAQPSLVFWVQRGSNTIWVIAKDI